MFSPQWPQVARSQDNISPVSALQLKPSPWDYSQNLFPFGCPLLTILANWQMASICLSHIFLFAKASLRFVQIPWPWWMSGPEVVKKKKKGDLKKGEVIKKKKRSRRRYFWRAVFMKFSSNAHRQICHLVKQTQGVEVKGYSHLHSTLHSPQSTLQLCWELSPWMDLVVGKVFSSREAF